MPGSMPNLTPYLGHWVALVRGQVAGVGNSQEEARLLAKHNRPKETPELILVSPGYQISQAVNSTANMQKYPLIPQIFDLVEKQHIPIYLVGGSVRDLLLGRETHDLDFAVDGDGLAVARHIADQLQAAYVAIDRERKTGRVILPALEKAPRFYIDIASLRGRDLEADLRDRDLTINAIALERTPEQNWRIIDPLNGCDDLQQGLLRAASETSFVNDPLRTMRTVRMGVQFGCTLEPATEARLRTAVPLLSQVSAERIRDEWFKILEQAGAANALCQLERLGLLPIIVPLPLSDMLSHSLATVGALEQLWKEIENLTQTRSSIPRPLRELAPLREPAPQLQERYGAPICDERTYMALLKCAAFLHPISETQMPEAESERRIVELAQRWRCSNKESDFLRISIMSHKQLLQLASLPALTSREIYCFFRDTGEYGLDAALVALACQFKQGQVVSSDNRADQKWMNLVETAGKLFDAYYHHYHHVIAPPLILSGNDLMAMGLPPGRQMGELLSCLREEQAAGKIQNRDQAIHYVHTKMQMATKSI